MAETLSPNPSLMQKQRAPIIAPGSPFFLGSNDDKLERAQARAARAAAIRRKSVAPNQMFAPPVDDCLGKNQIMELFQNCIKLASENKINQKNTWELSLIDHLCDIIKVEKENDVETNFQKASCTLEAGVKIYSMRVDSVHSEAYKVLGGINRVGLDNEQDSTVEDANINNEQVEGNSKKDQDRKLSPNSTLESSFEALNVKKFDAAFAVDPLYHQTSAQFDEGGAKGLLLNNLGVYGGCRVLFDSLEVPGNCMSCVQNDATEAIDISYARESVELMALNMSTTEHISPSLRDIVNQFGEENQRQPDMYSAGQNSIESVHEAYDNNDEFGGDAFEDSGTCEFDHDNQTSLADEGRFDGEAFPSGHFEENEPFNLNEVDEDDRFDQVDEFLFSNLGFAAKQNAWAGPDHWKYRKSKGAEDTPKENGSPLTTKKPRTKKQAEVDIDFTNSLDMDISETFAPPKNIKTLLLPANREACKTTLPEDCHYQPEDLVKLFLLPNVMCLGRRGRRCTDELNHGRDENGTFPSWDDDESGIGAQFDDGNAYSDVEDSSTLVSQPRQVNKIEVQYDKTSKQVDVQALKETLWASLQEAHESSQEETLSFKHIVATIPSSNRLAAPIEEISPHLCFICLLHLANEHGLSIHGSANLDELRIHISPENHILQSAH